MKRAVILIATCLLVTLVLAAAGAGAAHEQRTERGSLSDIGQVVLVGEDIVDLKWDAQQYPDPNDEPFLRWELWRGLSGQNMGEIARGTTGGFYRDRDIQPDTSYDYWLYVVRRDPEGLEHSYEVFKASAYTFFLAGTVYEDLKLSPREYEVFGVAVGEGVILAVERGTTLKGRGTSLEGVVEARGGGWLEIDGATLERIKLSFGKQDFPAEGGSGSVTHSHLEGVRITLWGDSKDVQVIDNTFVDLPNYTHRCLIGISDTSSALVRDNRGNFSVVVSEQSSATIDENHIEAATEPVRLWALATAELTSNYITTTEFGRGVVVGDEAHLTAIENHLYTTHEGSNLLLVEGSAHLTAKRNTIISGTVLVGNFGELNLTDYNVISGGTIFVSHQGKGTIEQNTIQGGATGFHIEGGMDYPDLYIRNNCIRNHTSYGLFVDDSRPDYLDVNYNYWGHETGPYHPTQNPNGQGDKIVGTKVNLTSWHKYPVYCQGTVPPPPDTGNITPSSGGTVESADGKVEVSFPPGAVDEDTEVTHQALTSEQFGVDGFIALGLFALEAITVSDGTPLTQLNEPYTVTFNKPYTITVEYSQDEVEGIQEESLKLYLLDGNDWTAVPTSLVDTQNNLLTATLDHMTVFAVMGEVAGEPGERRVYLPLVLRNY